jgi:hypothetical protein
MIGHHVCRGEFRLRRRGRGGGEGEKEVLRRVYERFVAAVREGGGSERNLSSEAETEAGEAKLHNFRLFFIWIASGFSRRNVYSECGG